MDLGSPTFEQMSRNLRRIMWAEFIDEQIRTLRSNQFRASLVVDPLGDPSNHNLVKHFDYHRSRGGQGG